MNPYLVQRLAEARIDDLVHRRAAHLPRGTGENRPTQNRPRRFPPRLSPSLNR